MIAAYNIGNDRYAALNPKGNLEIMQSGWNYEAGQITFGSAKNKKEAIEALDEYMNNQWFYQHEEKYSELFQ